MASADIFDVAHTMAEELRFLHPSTAAPIKLYTDNKSLFEAISKGSRTSEKRLIRDIAAARERFQRYEISGICSVRRTHKIADGLTRTMKQSGIRKVLQSGRLSPKFEQWIVRSAPYSSHKSTFSRDRHAPILQTCK